MPASNSPEISLDHQGKLEYDRKRFSYDFFRNGSQHDSIQIHHVYHKYLLPLATCRTKDWNPENRKKWYLNNS